MAVFVSVVRQRHQLRRASGTDSLRSERKAGGRCLGIRRVVSGARDWNDHGGLSLALEDTVTVPVAASGAPGSKFNDNVHRLLDVRMCCFVRSPIDGRHRGWRRNGGWRISFRRRADVANRDNVETNR